MYKDKKRKGSGSIIRENPFITSDAALGEDFYGREEEISQILEFLEKRKEHNFLIHGQRRIGKTSLLLKIKEIVEASQVGKAVFFDLQNKARLDISEVLFELAVQICSVTGADIDLKPGNFPGHDSSSFFKDVFFLQLFEKLPQNCQLILLFDEFDSLGELEGVKGTPKITNIAYHRFIPLLADIKKKEFPLKFIFAVGRNYKDLDENHYGQITKAGSQIELSYFNKEELKSMLKSSDDILPFEHGSIDRLYELTSGHPFFSQCLASSAFDAASKLEQKVVTPGIIDKQLEPAIKRHGGGVLWFWRGFPPHDRIILYLMARVKENNKKISEKTINEEASRLNFVPAIHELERVLERLINIRVLKKIHGKKPHYDFYVEFFRKWIVTENTVETIGKLLSKINPEIENYLMNGRFYYNQEDYISAQEYFRKVIDKFPSHYEAVLYLGHIAANLIDQEKGNIDKALEWFSRAYQLDPYGTKDEYLYVLNRKLTWLEEQNEDTETILKEIQRINPDDPGIVEKLVEIYIVENKDISEIEHLSKVRELNLENKHLQYLPVEIIRLKNLRKLDLRNNNISQLPPEIIDLNMELRWEDGYSAGILLKGNPLKRPPAEIERKGKAALKAYFKSAEGEKRALNEVRVLLVGDEGAGKTSLVKRLIGKEFDMNESLTQGINISPWEVKSGKDKIKVHLWDFGGQEIMHATHRFFLSKRSLYILVLDGRKDERIEYWLKLIDSFGGDSPVLVVINKIDENPGVDVNRKFLKEKYKSIKCFFRISCRSNEGIELFSKSLIENLSKVELIRTTWAASWFKIKTRLQNMKHDFISYDQYKTLCERENIKDRASQDTIVDFLSDLGVILHFKDFTLRETYVLNMNWVTNAIYKIISSKETADSGGLLKFHLLDEILKQEKETDYYYPGDKYTYIIYLMQKFELCFEVDENTILIPELLEIKEPSFDFDYKTALIFLVEYDFLPKSMMPRFMVKMHKDIKGELHWRTGVVLENKEFHSTAVVKADEWEKKIFIYVNGDQKKNYLEVLLHTLREINQSFEKLEAVEKVPMPDNPKITVSYQYLNRLERMGEEYYEPDGSEKKYYIRQLLGIIDENMFNQLLHQLKNDFAALSELRPQKRGFGYEKFLNKLFRLYDLNPMDSFLNRGEQIDGSFQMGNVVYLVEAKWQRNQTSIADLSGFNTKVSSKAMWTRGLFISISGFSTESLLAFAMARRTSIIGMDGRDLEYILNKELTLPEAISLKSRYAAETNKIHAPLSELKKRYHYS